MEANKINLAHNKKYDAFISYSHTDREFATQIQKSIETLGLPFYKKWQTNVHIFRDERKIPLSGSLTDQIVNGLKNSNYLIVIASKNSAASKWVKEEIIQWHKLNYDEEGFITNFNFVLIDDVVEWDYQNQDFNKLKTTALPSFETKLFKSLPIWGNIGQYILQGKVDKNNAYYQWEIAKIKALLLGKKPDEIIKEALVAKRAFRVAIGITILMLSFLTVFALFQRNDALREKAIAESRYLAIIAQRLSLDDPELANLLAIEAYEIWPTDEAYSLLLNLPQLRPQLEAMLHGTDGEDATSSASSIIFNEKDNILISAGLDGYVRYWDIKSGQETQAAVKVFENGLTGIDQMTFNDQNQLIALTGIDSNYFSTIRLINYSTNKLVEKEYGFQAKSNNDISKFSSLQFSPDGDLLFSGCTNGKVYIWKVSDEDLTLMDSLVVMNNSDNQHYNLYGVGSLSLSSNGNKLITGDESGDIQVWDIENKLLDKLLGEHMGKVVPSIFSNYNVYSAAINNQQGVIASGGADGIVRLWNLSENKSIDSLALPLPVYGNYGFSSVTDISFLNQSDSLLVAMYPNGIFLVWDWKNSTVTSTNYGQDWIYNEKYNAKIAYSKALKRLAVARNDGNISVWNVSKEGHETGQPLYGHIGDITNVVFNHNNNLIISSGYDGSIRFWDLKKATELREPLQFGSKPIPVSSFEFAYDQPVYSIKILESKLYCLLDEEGIIVYDLVDNRLVDTLIFDNDFVPYTMISDETNNIIATLDETGTLINIYSAHNKTNYLIEDSSFEGEGIINLEFQAKTGLLTLLTDGGKIIFFDLKKRTIVKQIMLAEDDNFSKISYNNEGTLIALGDEFSGEILLIDAIKFNILPVRLTGHEEGITSLTFHPKKKIIASSSEDGTIRLWSLDNFLQIGSPFIGHDLSSRPGLYSHDEQGQVVPTNFINTTEIGGLKFSDDGQFLISGGSDGTIRYWTINPDELIRVAKLQAGRPLRNDEKLKYLGN